MRETISQFMCSSLVYKLFYFVELMQNIYFVMHPILKFEFTIVYIQYFRQVIQYSQLSFILDAMDQNQSTILLYTAFGLQIIVCLLFALCVHSVNQKKKITTITSYSFKAISFYALIQITFLHICFINIFIIFLYCQPDSQFSFEATCYSGIYVLHTIMAAFGLMFFTIIQYYFTTFYIDLKQVSLNHRPESDVPFAQSQSRYDYFKLLVKFEIIIFITIDYKYEHSGLYIVIQTILYFLLLCVRIFEPPHFQNATFQFLLTCDNIQFCIAFAYTLHKFLDSGPSDNVGFYFIIAALPFTYHCSLQVCHKKNNYFLTTGVKKLGDANFHEQYFNLLLNLVKEREEQLNFLILEGILVQHMETCQNTICPCVTLNESKTKDLDEMQWYKFVIMLIELSLSKFPKCCKLYLLQAHIYNDNLHNKFKSYYSIQHVQHYDSTLREEFQVFKNLHELEVNMQEEDQKADIVIDVLQVVKFQKYYGQFQNKLEESVKLHFEFWCELLENNPDIQKLFTLGSQITQSVEDVREIYDKLTEINSNHINTLRTFGQFQVEVINSDNFGVRILEKAAQIENAQLAYSSETSTDKYGENSNTCIMTCSAEPKSLGLIQTCNKEIEKLGYHKYELVNQQITRLMPKCYSDCHDSFMQKYLETNESKIVGIERVVYCQHKNGSIVPAQLMFKIMPQVKKGLRMVSFLKVLENYDNNYYILFNPQNFLILGISQNCQDVFGIPVNFVYGNQNHSNEFTVEVLLSDFNHLVDKLKQQQESTTVAFPLQIDTTKLQKQFIIEDSVDRLSLMEEEINKSEQLKSSGKKESPFKIQKISCLLERQQYSNLEVAILKFTEATAFQEASKSGNYYQSELKIKSKQTKYSTSTTRKKADNQQVNEDYLNEDRSSVNSVQSSLNDDMRRLKDFKALMSEKNVPKNIRTIQITMLSLTLILLTVSIVDLVMKGIQNSQFMHLSSVLGDVHSRTNQMSTIALHSRLLQLIGTGQYWESTGMTAAFLRTDLLARLQYVQQVQFDSLRLSNYLKKYDVSLPDLDMFNLTSLLVDGTQSNFTLQLIDSVREQVSHLIVIIGSNLSDFNSTTFILPAQQSFFFLNYNGLRSVRTGLEVRDQQFYEFMTNLAAGKFNTFLILMIISIFILIATHAIVIPILLKVDKANNKVLNMFGLIPQAEIKELSEKCEKFLKEFIEDYNEKKEIENKIKQENNEGKPGKGKQTEDKHYIEVNNEEHQELDEHQKGELEKQKQIEEEKERLRLEKIEEERRKKLEEENNQKRFMRHKKNKKKKHAIQEIELSEEEKERVEKLERSNDRKDSSALLKFMMFFILFTGFFVMQLVLEVYYLDNINFLFTHLRLSHRRYSILMYRVVFGVEDIVQNTSITLDSEWMQQYYHNAIYEVERDVFQSYLNFQLSGYSTYLEYYNWFNFNDMCSNISIFFTLDPTITETGCRNVQNGILEKGLRTSVISLALYINDTLSLNQGSDLSTLLNGDPMEIVNANIKYLRPAFNTLNQAFLSDSQTYISYAQSVEIIKFVVLIIAWIILFFIIWMPYLTKLSIQIWQTKGMLNMIPMNIIQKNEKLKFRFLQDNIMTMVQ